MNTISHPEMVAALVKPGADILASLTPETTNLWHAATGIAGEAGELLAAFLEPELDRENVIEELGDLEFYIEQLTQAVWGSQDGRKQLLPAIADELSALDAAMLVAVEAGNTLDLVKKAAVYSKPLDRELLDDTVARLEVAMDTVMFNLDITQSETKQHNIDKLSVRYAGLQYSDQAAQDRADKAA